MIGLSNDEVQGWIFVADISKMSRHASHERVVTIADSTEVLEVIREEQASPIPSSVIINDPKAEVDVKKEKPIVIFPCKGIKDAEQEKKKAEEIENLVNQKEMEMEGKFQERLENEMQYLKDRFEFILQNEQVRASYMLREAHRERKEKISALQTQLQCKNMAGLMYVLCSERRKSKLEILKLTEEYTNYIEALQNILTESQALILHLSRGYKTAARVDHEWREKTKKLVKHFQNFVTHFVGGCPETNQYLFDLPDLLKINAPIRDDPKEDPCDDEGETETVLELEPEKTWWERLEGEDRPFVMFGDMADFKPPQRREVLRTVKANKTAPKKWKEYVFNEMFLKSKCDNVDMIKNKYPVQHQAKWENNTQTDRQPPSIGSETSRRVTTASVDIRGNMGSILKIITSTGAPTSTPKNTLLGARDSMEIASTTKLREKHRHTADHGKVVLNVGNKIDSIFDERQGDSDEETIQERRDHGREPMPKEDEEEVGDESVSLLGSVHNDSLAVIQTHVPDMDSKINYEKICPMDKCQRMQVDSFMRSLPSYMRANPFTHFDQTYDEYEACSPEQLEILKQRIEEKKKKEKVDFSVVDDPLQSWTPSVEGVAIQTSDMSLPPCTCMAPSPTPVASECDQKIYTVADLIPVKQELDRINAECFFDYDIEFNRFKVIGQDESAEHMKCGIDKNFTQNRLHEIKKILKQHPSLCEIFQANIRC